jgi:hypothetical protein
MRLLSTPLLALCATTLLSSPLLGQTPDRSVDRLRTAIMERLDTDGDGNISAEEAQAGRKALKERGGIQALPEPIRNAIIKRFNKNDDVKGTDGRPGVKETDKRSDAKGTDGRPGVKGNDKRSDAKGSDRRPGVKGNDKRPDAKGTDGRPGVKGVRPEGQSSGLGHLARFDLNGDGVIDAEEAQNARALMQRLRGGNGPNRNSDSPTERPQSSQQRRGHDSSPSRGAGPGPDGPGIRGPQGDRGQRDNVRNEGAQQGRDVRGRGPEQNTARRRPSPQDMRRRIQSMRDKAGRGRGDGRQQSRQQSRR